MVLFFVVVVTGIYITLFFEFGFEGSYQSVADLNGHPIQRVMRSLHRYSSAALVVTTLVHAWRIFVAARFQGPRRWRWATGVTALVIVWVAGVTGYWLIWDERAQLLNEAMAVFLDFVRIGRTTVTAVLTSDGSGSLVLLTIWFVHLLVTAVIGWFLWRHLRRTRLPWLPPALWTGLMILSLVVVSVALPVEMLEPADLNAIVGEIPIDPFFLFLFPGFSLIPVPVVLGLSLVIVLFAFGLPWLLRRGEDEVVEILADDCTGCELCIADCPYEALTMVPHGDGEIAQVEPSACVACGICIGSCVFDAIQLPGVTVPAGMDVTGREVVLACERHRRLSSPTDTEVITVRCTGVISPTVMAGLVKSGAESVQVVGCPPGDCAYGIGNTLAAERLEGERRPRVPIVAARKTDRDWVAPTALRNALAQRGSHLSADPKSIPKNRWRLSITTGIVLLSIVLIGLATTVVFSPDRPEAAVVVVVHHEPGAVIAATGSPSGAPGVPSEVLVEVGSEEPLVEQVGRGSFASGVISVPTTPGPQPVRVVLVEGDARTVMIDEEVDLEAGRRLVVMIEDEQAFGATEGEDLFFSSDTGCSVCHSVEPGVELVGPNLAGVARRAGSRVPGLDSEEYLRQSILDPNAYIVEGFRSNLMLDIYEDSLSEDEIDALVAYLLTLDSE